MSPRARTVVGGVLLVALAASAAYGGNFRGLRDELPPPASRTKAGAFGPAGVPGATATGIAARRSQPYWREVTRFSGRGDATSAPFTVDARALQWRVRWTCEEGELVLQPRRPEGDPHGHPLARASCPQEGEGRSIAHGAFRLAANADGPWTARVEQQLDVPLVEPPTRTMTARRRIARGRFYGIDEQGSGTVELFRAPDGALEVRLQDFHVTPNVDLELRLSTLGRPRSTAAVMRAPHRDVAFLEATTGSMNYRIPARALPRGFESVVIWCEITHNAYAAAALGG